MRTNHVPAFARPGLECGRKVEAGSLSGTEADLILAAGDRLSVVFGGTLTAVAGVVVTFEFEVL